MHDIAWVALGGIFGAVCRYLVSRWAAQHVTASFPVGTLAINLVGSLIIGFFLIWTTERVLADPRWRLLIAIGFCGAFTTFSSFAFETLKMYEEGAVKLAVLNILGNNVASLGAVVLGAVIARKIG
ncbi:MAG TPA: fluoride efflux transporter CrcB [Terriglobales bacterium]|nr:fluoride efflux transporter CrcB [Terriglobales bacterium]